MSTQPKANCASSLNIFCEVKFSAFALSSVISDFLCPTSRDVFISGKKAPPLDNHSHLCSTRSFCQPSDRIYDPFGVLLSNWWLKVSHFSLFKEENGPSCLFRVPLLSNPHWNCGSQSNFDLSVQVSLVRHTRSRLPFGVLPRPLLFETLLSESFKFLSLLSPRMPVCFLFRIHVLSPFRVT